MANINKLPCQMKIEFPTYDELSEKTKSFLDKLRSNSVEIYVWQDYETDAIQFDYYSYTSFEEGRYDIYFDIRTDNINSEFLEFLEENYDEETVQKILTSYNNKMTTVNTFIEIGEYLYVEKSSTKGDRPAFPKNPLNYNHWKEMQESGGDLTKGGEQLRGDWTLVSTDFIPVTVKYYVNGALNTNENLAPVPYYNTKYGIDTNPRFIDFMPSDANALADIIHRDAFRSLSKNYCIIPYVDAFIAELRGYNSDAVKDIYISNYMNSYTYSETITETFFIKLPKDKYVIDSNGMIRDPSNTNNSADLSEFNINSNLMFEDRMGGYEYLGNVYAVLDIEKLGIESVTGKMIINASFQNEGGESKARYLGQLFINPIYCNEDIDLSDEIGCNTFYEDFSNGMVSYSFIGGNGFSSRSSEFSGFGAKINNVNYDLAASGNTKIILGFKDDGYPNSLYILKIEDVEMPTDLVCGYIDESTQQLVEIDQDVTAYVFDLSKLPQQATAEPT